MKESSLLAGSSAKGSINEFVVRIDELNVAAPHLDPVVVARRMFEISDDMLASLYPGEADSRNAPSTGAIWERLQALRTDEEVEQETAEPVPEAPAPPREEGRWGSGPLGNRTS